MVVEADSASTEIGTELEIKASNGSPNARSRSKTRNIRRRRILTLVLVNLAAVLERADEALLPAVYDQVSA
jgi:hypothetical protein